MQSIILIAAPEILAIPTKENQDPLVDIITLQGLVYGPSPEIPNNTDYTKMRKTVFDKLIEAQTMLPKGLRFCLYEGFRSLQLQKKLFDERFSRVRNQHPHWSESQLFTETTKLVSPVVNQDGTPNIPPHSTGGAVDVYLIDDNNVAVDMGIHPEKWMDDVEGSLSLTDSTCISKQAQMHRRIMCEVLAAVGFVNYPTEYWHWSYGDRYWAYHKQEAAAVYDSINKLS